MIGNLNLVSHAVTTCLVCYRFRQYGLWERYAELYPNEDLVYTVGISDYRKDWFFAQVNRKKDNGTDIGTTWQINFKLDSVNTN
ncbi:hypothetical protein glysoja_021844 [Glycine soja]|nr:hypothetical protein glysoja_021844 [Glycine soja]